MKNFIYILVFIIIANSAFAQINLPIDSSKNKIIYSEVVQSDSILKSELFKRAKQFFVYSFNSSNNVIQQEDENDGVIIGKGILNTSYKTMNMVYSAKIKFTLTILVKDFKYKYEITQLVLDDNNSGLPKRNCEDMIKSKDRIMGMSYQKTYNKILINMNDDIHELISLLKEKMNTNSKQKSDW